MLPSFQPTPRVVTPFTSTFSTGSLANGGTATAQIDVTGRIVRIDWIEVTRTAGTGTSLSISVYDRNPADASPVSVPLYGTAANGSGATVGATNYGFSATYGTTTGVKTPVAIRSNAGASVWLLVKSHSAGNSTYTVTVYGSAAPES